MMLISLIYFPAIVRHYAGYCAGWSLPVCPLSLPQVTIIFHLQSSFYQPAHQYRAAETYSNLTNIPLQCSFPATSWTSCSITWFGRTGERSKLKFIFNQGIFPTEMLCFKTAGARRGRQPQLQTWTLAYVSVIPQTNTTITTNVIEFLPETVPLFKISTKPANSKLYSPKTTLSQLQPPPHPILIII